ncbi:MBL fold metallo-hydrolase [Aliiroseovarius subalbicans]|uniref:MBL fold metallo-hydrolase n=1 Tax=Aliiroseovarius subalbicans TaxID=2925840 RepID=UPI001F5A06E0|nr:MBL fold metallo-hydrolase [Aliiroseovarius subalbicans]MCI2398189.1 MBL fold metallo-hydrolase [Aliiroseovarius subalbicans]
MDQMNNAPPVGILQRLEPGIRRILAPNPSPMTFWGTNTYVVGEGRVAVIDPGPALPAHYDAILGGLNHGEVISHILVTHAHLDHSPLARPLSEATGAPVLAYGDATAGRSAVMRDLVARGMASGGEGVDRDFNPDSCVADGDILDFGDWRMQAIWTPGHFANHMSFALEDAVFTADHVMGWASSLVSPPDGDLTAFMASCRRLAAREDRIYYPGHGAPVTDPAARVNWLIQHRLGREAEILAALDGPPQDIPSLTRRIYTETPKALLPAAARNVFAHLIDLTTRDLVRPAPMLDFTAKFTRIG